MATITRMKKDYSLMKHTQSEQLKHDQKIKSKLLEFRTGIKQNAIKEKSKNKTFAVDKPSRPLSEVIKEIQEIINSFNNKRKSVNRL
jgi:hypothetical protein